ncbi:unnamed protein product [Brassica rapa]|uniref:RIN4 pathogenic type III effector avirulence factor Avr cleavage site domain-containing protein n=3 Tax=Brassica TaxID=3705 RepID=A0A3P6D025_BRACM|nr:unnamed protein product [Brassica napus]CAG7911615.1 unnamed protein product [Brassica rapa]VDD20280.1 unnamed protein product [Brassica rapa]
MYQETQQLYQLWRLAIQERDEAREQLMHSLAELSQLRELLNTVLLSKEKIRSYYLEPADESTGHQNYSYDLFPGESPSNFSVNSCPLDLSVLSNQMCFVVENMRDYETVVLEMIGGVLPENGFNQMEDDRKEKNSPWLSVPQFGDWDQKGGGTIPDYSMDFTKIREMRKQNKRDPSRASLGNEDELVKPPESATATAKLTTVHSENQHHFSPAHHHQPHSPSTRRSIFSCFNCCVKA